eukprot:UN02587
MTFLLKAAMESDGWSFSAFNSRAFQGRPSNHCRNVPRSSYCGFLHPRHLAITYTFTLSGEASLHWGHSANRGAVVVSLNSVQIARRNARGSQTTSFSVSPGDVLEIKEIGASVINIRGLTITPSIFNDGAERPPNIFLR